jgi:hypothetical protein
MIGCPQWGYIGEYTVKFRIEGIYRIQIGFVICIELS